MRTLGLAAAVRAFNEAAVPGIGGLWFGRPLMLALLGIRLANETAQSNITVANAIEALACLFDLQDGAATTVDPRLRGRRKLAGRSADLPFATVAKRSFYVTQPMRIGMTQPLVALGFAHGFADSSRFNALQVSDIGYQFLAEALDESHLGNLSIEKRLTRWIKGEIDSADTLKLRKALSLQSALPERARRIFKSRLRIGSGGDRRSNAMDWLRDISGKQRVGTGWSTQPWQINDDHWADLGSGGRFFAMRVAAVTCLDKVEGVMAESGQARLPWAQALQQNEIARALSNLDAKVKSFQELNHTPTDAEEANTFADKLASCNEEEMLRLLVERDGRILLSSEDAIGRGSAFDPSARLGRTSTSDDEDDADAEKAGERLPLPENISYRIRNLALLGLDLEDKLGRWLTGEGGW